MRLTLKISKNSIKSFRELTTNERNWSDISAATQEKNDCINSKESESFCGMRYSHLDFFSLNNDAQAGIHLFCVKNFALTLHDQ